MKYLVIALLTFLGCCWLSVWIGRAEAQDDQGRAFNLESYFDRVANAIKQAEGTNHPYGLKGFTQEQEHEARAICLNTIRNSHKVWSTHQTDMEFTDFLSLTYVPPDSDKEGNLHWRRNVKLILSKP